MKRTKKILRDIAMLVSLTLVLSSVCVGITAAGSKEACAREEETVQAKDAAPCKNETVYVLADAAGNVDKVIVSDWIQNTAQAQSIRDTAQLDNIEVTRGDAGYVMDADGMCIWDAQGGDVYYEGTTDKRLPVQLSLSFQLDGAPISAQALAGRSGRVTIRFDYENTEVRTVSIDGKPVQMYVPFVMLSGMALQSEHFSNVTVTNGRVINDGSRLLVVGLALPKMQENLGVDRKTLEIPDYVEVSADVTDFSLGTTLSVAVSGFGDGLALEDISSAEELETALQTLDESAVQLVDGMAALSDGLAELQGQSGSLREAVTQLSALAAGAGKVSEGARTLYGYLQQLSSGLNTISAQSRQLDDGARQTFAALLGAADAQLAAAGLQVEALTIDNYAAVLDGVIGQLSSDDVYNMAYQSAYAAVSATVEASREYITAQVTAAVRQQVLEAVLAAQGCTMEQYNADAALHAAIDAAVDAQMQSQEVQSSIAQAVEAKIQALIEENMQSEAVQQQIQAAVAQAQAGCNAVQALKGQLDAYLQFYQGVLAYTAGVDEACAAGNQITAGAEELVSGAGTLSAGAGALYQGMNGGTGKLLGGVGQLCEGAGAIQDGMQSFYAEGVHKLTQLYQDDISPLLARLRVMADLADSYRSFTGLADGMDGSVKFIYRTDSIEVAAPEEE